MVLLSSCSDLLHVAQVMLWAVTGDTEETLSALNLVRVVVAEAEKSENHERG